MGFREQIGQEKFQRRKGDPRERAAAAGGRKEKEEARVEEEGKGKLLVGGGKGEQVEGTWGLGGGCVLRACFLSPYEGRGKGGREDGLG